VRPGEILVQEDKRTRRLTYPEMVEIDSVETQPAKNKYLCSDRWIAVFDAGITIYARNESDGAYRIKASVNGPTWRPNYSGGGSWLALNKCAVIAEDHLFYITQKQDNLVFCDLTLYQEGKSSQLSGKESIPFIQHFEIERTALLPPGTKDKDDNLEEIYFYKKKIYLVTSSGSVCCVSLSEFTKIIEDAKQNIQPNMTNIKTIWSSGAPQSESTNTGHTSTAIVATKLFVLTASCLGKSMSEAVRLMFDLYSNKGLKHKHSIVLTRDMCTAIFDQKSAFSSSSSDQPSKRTRPAQLTTVHCMTTCPHPGYPNSVNFVFAALVQTVLIVLAVRSNKRIYLVDSIQVSNLAHNSIASIIKSKSNIHQTKDKALSEVLVTTSDKVFQLNLIQYRP